MKAIVIAALMMLLIFPTVSAQNNHMKLLAVTEQTDGSYKGAVADLFVEIHPGTGRVFMDTFPLSRIDTQISTRFAKEIACEYSGRDCSQLDFFYTIRSSSAIITGPSAGAALATLTLATLEDAPVNDKVSITGTINSGGLIGPVSGVKEKIEAGALSGLSTILIPIGEGIQDENNKTINLTSYGKAFRVKVHEVIQLEDAYYYVTGIRLPERQKNFSIDPNYISNMKAVAQKICERSTLLSKEVSGKITNATIAAQVANFTLHGNQSFNDGQYYAAASFCFASNVRFSTILLQSSNITDRQIIEEAKNISAELQKRKRDIPQYKTIADLETYALVLERLVESEQSLNASLTALAGGDRNNALRSLAFARERLNSADSWSVFFGSQSRQITIDSESLQNSCINKLAEAEERYQYVHLFLPDALQSTRTDLDSAYYDFGAKRFDFCLFKASKSKAEADAVLSAIGVSENQMQNVLDQRQNAARIVIARQTAKGNFPIAGYSYYEYANSLRNIDPASALLFYEYALELSNLDIYFKQQATAPSRNFAFSNATERSISAGILLVSGILMGLIAGILISRKKTHLERHKSHYNHVRKAAPRTGGPRGPHMPGKKR